MYTVKISKNKRGRYQWRLIADNGKIMSGTTQPWGYKDKADCKECLQVILGRDRYNMLIAGLLPGFTYLDAAVTPARVTP